jgi:hypothetical protein
MYTNEGNHNHKKTRLWLSLVQLQFFSGSMNQTFKYYIQAPTMTLLCEVILLQLNLFWRLMLRCEALKFYSCQSFTVSSTLLNNAGGMQTRCTMNFHPHQKKQISRKTFLQHWRWCHWTKCAGESLNSKMLLY